MYVCPYIDVEPNFWLCHIKSVSKTQSNVYTQIAGVTSEVSMPTHIHVHVYMYIHAHGSCYGKACMMLYFRYILCLYVAMILQICVVGTTYHS